MSEIILEAVPVSEVRPGTQYLGFSGTVFTISARNVHENGNVSIELHLPEDETNRATMTFSDPTTMLNIVK